MEEKTGQENQPTTQFISFDLEPTVRKIPRAKRIALDSGCVRKQELENGTGIMPKPPNRQENSLQVTQSE
jgi:hypothetical protein